MHTFPPSTRLFLLTLTACALYAPGSHAEGQSQASGTVQTLGAAPVQGARYAYAFLLPPFLIRNNWVFWTTDGQMLLAPTPQAMTVNLGGSRPAGSDVLPMYAQIGRLGWELVRCSRDDEAAAPGFDGPGCVFKKTF